MFLRWENYKKHCLLSKIAFEIPLFLIKEVCEQTAAFNYYKYGYFLHDQEKMSSKRLYALFTMIANSLVSFFNLLFSKCVKNSSNILNFLQSWLKM